ncbi:thymidylate kinase [Photorhabdus luminescens]|nr:thymidylate kinase [Photorhabdus luminescens]
MIKRGLFIAFEGNDGAGKSTISREIYDILSLDYNNIVFLDKNYPLLPSGYSMYHMGKIRDILWDYDISAPLGELGDRHWILLIASWFSVLDSLIIQPCLLQGKIIICDSWYYKYLARFLLKSTELAELSKSVLSINTKPDMVIYLDVPPNIAEKRKRILKPSESGKLEINENYDFIEYQKHVLNQYQTFYDDTWKIIDTDTLTKDAVIKLIVDIIQMEILKKM